MKPWSLANTLLGRTAMYLADPFLLGIRLYWGWQFFETGKGKLSDISAPTAFFTELGLPFPQMNAYMAGWGSNWHRDVTPLPRQRQPAHHSAPP